MFELLIQCTEFEFSLILADWLPLSSIDGVRLQHAGFCFTSHLYHVILIHADQHRSDR